MSASVELHKPDPVKEARSFLRHVFNHEIDDITDVSAGIQKRLELAGAEFNVAGRGCSLCEYLEHSEKALMLMNEARGMVDAYLEIAAASHLED